MKPSAFSKGKFPVEPLGPSKVNRENGRGAEREQRRGGERTRVLDFQCEAEGAMRQLEGRVKLLPKRTFLSSAGDFMVMI